MRKLLVASSMFMLAIAAAPAPAAPDSSHAGPAIGGQVVYNGSEAVVPVAGGTAPAAAERKVCRQLPSSSSRLPNRVCLTQKEWKQVDEDSGR